MPIVRGDCSADADWSRLFIGLDLLPEVVGAVTSSSDSRFLLRFFLAACYSEIESAYLRFDSYTMNE